MTFINLIKAEKLLTPNLQCVLKKTIFKFKQKYGKNMGIKFDGTKVKDGSKTIGNVYRDALKEGSSTGGKTLGNIYRDSIRLGSSSGGKTLCNIYRGDIREGSSTGGKKLISLKDAAKKIGTSSQGHSTALVWWFFAR